MNFYRAYHVDAAGETVGHLNFQADDDTAACTHAGTIQRTGNWPALELWVNTRQVECSDDICSDDIKEALKEIADRWKRVAPPTMTVPTTSDPIFRAGVVKE